MSSFNNGRRRRRQATVKSFFTPTSTLPPPPPSSSTTSTATDQQQQQQQQQQQTSTPTIFIPSPPSTTELHCNHMDVQSATQPDNNNKNNNYTITSLPSISIMPVPSSIQRKPTSSISSPFPNLSIVPMTPTTTMKVNVNDKMYMNMNMNVNVNMNNDSPPPTPPSSPSQQLEPQPGPKPEPEPEPEPELQLQLQPCHTFNMTKVEKETQQPDHVDDTPITDLSVVETISTSSTEGHQLQIQPVIRKRRRPHHNHSPPVQSRSRPRTRASIRNTRTPSPPARRLRSSIANKSNDDSFIDLNDSPTPQTRLNRAKNAARRAAAGLKSNSKNTKKDDSVVEQSLKVENNNHNINNTDNNNNFKGKPISNPVIFLHDQNYNPNLDVVYSCSETHYMAPTFTGTTTQHNLNNTTKPQEHQQQQLQQKITINNNTSNNVGGKKRSLHPFFAATKVAVNTARDRVKIPRIERLVCDAWVYPSSTIHVNNISPSTNMFSNDIKNTSMKSFITWCKFLNDQTERRKLLQHHEPLPSHVNYTNTVGNYTQKQTRRLVQNSIVKTVEDDTQSFDMWTQKYRTDNRLDVINSTAIEELSEWLKPWYSKQMTAGEANNNEQILNELNENSYDRDHTERILLLSGPVGCGKSNIIQSVANKLGLSILEINNSVIRTGKKIRDIIGEALRTHRINNCNQMQQQLQPQQQQQQQQQDNNKKPKTLIVFEEVDEIQQYEEKGFWNSLIDIIHGNQSNDFKRPIICTSNSFNCTMKQIFNSKSYQSIKNNNHLLVHHDLNRLFMHNLKDDLSITADSIPFKLIHFGHYRSERQTLSVLQRISKSENINTQWKCKSLCECIAVLNRLDTRRAINELQFWGANGLSHSLHPPRETESETESDDKTKDHIDFHVGMNIISSNGAIQDIDITLTYALFCTASESYSFSSQQQQSDNSSHSGDQLGAYANTLESISEMDTIVGYRRDEMMKRSDENLIAPDAICLDSDLCQVEHMVSDVCDHSLHYCNPFLSLSPAHVQTCDIARRIPIAQHPRQQVNVDVSNIIGQVICRARQPILSDYLPTLISMVRAADEVNKHRSGSEGTADVIIEQPLRRTRSRTKQSGLSALNLNNATVSLLRQLSIANKIIDKNKT